MCCHDNATQSRPSTGDGDSSTEAKVNPRYVSGFSSTWFTTLVIVHCIFQFDVIKRIFRRFVLQFSL